ncbi:UNVERIFIED_CONTAM: hypothetical protein PYX00_011040 [Menopon gallinae]|uniref:20 kDa chaperonin, chloroplastic n=1 Tax=Menopon gallinae TaxID=328185 RepID=A0AAW2H696_9NEOP
MSFKPLFDNVLIERVEQSNKTKGGVIIPDTAKEKPIEGKVIATGPGKVNEQGQVIKLTVKEGDIVVFSKWGGTEITLEGKEYLILKESDLLGIKG